jgi:sec-independent protein translocase protein TatA
MSSIGWGEILIVVVIALLVFGPKKLPDLGTSLGRSISGFKKGLRDSTDELKAAVKEDATVEHATVEHATADSATAAPASVTTTAGAPTETETVTGPEPATATATETGEN